jgi:hypothetical protein
MPTVMASGERQSPQQASPAHCTELAQVHVSATCLQGLDNHLLMSAFNDMLQASPTITVHSWHDQCRNALQARESAH